MTLPRLAKVLPPIATLLAVLACSGGEDGDGTGDGDGDGDGTGGMPGDGDGDAGTGGTGDGDGDGDGTGGGPPTWGSGSISVDFAGTPVNFEVFNASLYPTGFVIASDSIDSDTVDSLSLDIDEPGVGTFDCSDYNVAVVRIQAPASDGDIASYESGVADDCTLTITEYGAVGEPIRGTFSGLVETTGSGEEATIENGMFDVIRGSDM